MNKHLTTLRPRTVDPITNQFELGFKSVDTVVADTFDAKVLDMILTLFDPKSAVTTRSLTGNELTRRRHVVDVGVLSRGGMKQSQLVLELLRQVYYRESQPPVSIDTTSSARGG